MPNCGYSFTPSYAFSTTDSVTYITEGTDITPSVEVYSQDGADAGTQTVTMATTFTIASGQGQTTLSLSGTGVVPDVTFDVVLTNPCATATINNIVFSSNPIAVTDGNTATATFSTPTDSVDSTNTVQGLCGPKSYVIKDSNGATVTTWATITVSSTGTHTLTIDSTQFPTHFSSAVSETLTVETTLDTWSVTNTASTVTVNLDPTACDCSALAWTAPAITVASVNIDATSTPTIPAPNSDTSATSSNFAFANCYEDGNTCATTGSYAAISDFTVDDGTGAVSLTGHAFLSWDVSS